MERVAEIRKNIDYIKKNLLSSELIAVSKYHTASDIEMAYECGCLSFGESKVQDLAIKSDSLLELCPDISWHFIGHLQKNKINNLLKVKNLKYIHSIDSLGLLETLYKKESNVSEKIKFFLQVNTSGEDEKSGVSSYDQLKKMVEVIVSKSSEKLEFCGLMTIGKIRTTNFEKDAVDCFEKLKGLRDSIEKDFGISNLKLSMGMSQDYKLAIEMGSDFIRVGSAIFN